MKHSGHIFITGAAGGIGRASARLFAAKGYFVGLTDIDRAGLVRLATELGNDNVYWKEADVRSANSLAGAISGFAKHTGGSMNILLNNAGILRAGNFEEIALREYIDMIEINLLGMLNGIYEALPLLEKSENPRIINLSSASAIYGIPGLAVYSATKFAIRGLSEALNIELEKKGIWVTDIMPGYVKTPMVEHASHSLHLEEEKALLAPEEVAENIWKATRHKRLHWPVGKKIRLLFALNSFLPPSLRRTLAIRGSHYKKR